MYQFTFLIIIKLGDLMTVKLNAVEAHVTPGFQELLKEGLQLFPLLVLLETVSDHLLACIFSFKHVIKLANHMICEFNDRVEMPQLEQGIILVDTQIYYWERFFVSLYILETSDHVLEGLGSY
jgi:hypothetical protein